MSFPPWAALVRALSGHRWADPFTADWADVLDSLGLPATTFRDVAARGSLHPHFRYYHFTRPKPAGGSRTLSEPDPRLKRIQREIVARYLADEPLHPVAIAYRAGWSIADHVWPHTGAEIIITADIEDFFPNTRADRVETWWRDRVGPEQARLLTTLTTDRGGLPQGAPTSPALSNLVNHDLDDQLSHRATTAGATYTRYSDDMVFSWRTEPRLGTGFENGVRNVLMEFGYTLHPKKGWRIHESRDEPEVTGLILSRHGGVRLPDRIVRAMREAARNRDPQGVCRLAGYRGYAAMIRKPRRL